MLTISLPSKSIPYLVILIQKYFYPLNYQKHLVYHMERLAAINSTSSNVEKKIVLLIDYVGFSLSNSPPLKTSKETLSILQNHYPETLHCAYCIRWVIWSSLIYFIFTIFILSPLALISFPSLLLFSSLYCPYFSSLWTIYSYLPSPTSVSF